MDGDTSALAADLTEPGSSVLFIGNNRETGQEMFSNLVQGGRPGLAICRRLVGGMESGRQQNPVMHWLSESRCEHCLHPGDLNVFQRLCSNHLRNNMNVVLFFDGIIYLLSHHAFDDVLKMIQALRDLVVIHNANLICSIPEGALMESDQLRLCLEFEFIGIENQEIRSHL